MGNCLRPYVSLEDRHNRRNSERSNAYLSSDPISHVDALQQTIAKFNDQDYESPNLLQTNSTLTYSPDVAPLSRLFTSSNDDKASFIPIDPSLMHISEREDLSTITDTLFLKRFYCNSRNLTIPQVSFPNSQSGIRKFSSTSSVFIDSSTVTQPNMKHTLKCVSLALHNLLIFDSLSEHSSNIDIFDERLHPVSTHINVCLDGGLSPEPRHIYKFMKHLFHSAQLTAECAIITLIYLERLLIFAEIGISVFTWRRILLGSILLSSKVWDDQAVWNVDYCHILKDLQVDDVNEMERHFLELLQFDINVPSSVYAKYYFDLRTFAELNNISLPLEPLNRQRAVHLEALTIITDPDIEYFQMNTRSNSVDQVFPSKSFVILN